MTVTQRDDIPEMMLAAQVVEYHKPYKIHKVPTPKPSDLAPYELLLKVAVASYCHTDHMVIEGIFQSKLPLIASHEGSGVVAAIGSDMTSQWKLGDRVMAALARGRCGECPDCKGPAYMRHYCPYQQGACGITLDGAFAEYMVVDGRESSKIPDNVSFTTAAPLACAGCTIYRSLLETGVKPGEWIAIVGSGGGLGHIGIKMGKALGYKILAIDARDIGLELSRQSGADETLDSRIGETEAVKKVTEITGDRGKHSGVPASIVLADGAESFAASITAMHGTLIQVAQPTNFNIPFHHLIFRDIRVRGSLHAARDTAQDMLNLVADKNVVVDTVEFQGLEELEKLREMISKKEVRGKAVIVVDASLK